MTEHSLAAITRHKPGASLSLADPSRLLLTSPGDGLAVYDLKSQVRVCC